MFAKNATSDISNVLIQSLIYIDFVDNYAFGGC